MQKICVIDTNVLIENPNYCDVVETERQIIIPIVVIEELDKLKSRQDEVGMNSRIALKNIEKWIEKGTIKVEIKQFDPNQRYTAGISNDNVIIDVAYQYHLSNNNVIFISNDVSARCKCKALGIKSKESAFFQEIVKETATHAYTGVRVIDNIDNSIIDKIYKDKHILFSELSDLNFHYPNEIIVLKSINQSAMTIVTKDKLLVLLTDYAKTSGVFGLTPRNKEQNFALELLLNPDIKLVTLTGKAGCGKTLITVAAALHQLKKIGEKGTYQKLVITRPIQPVGKDIGFLPGTLHEKLHPWFSPIRDNFDFLIKNKNTTVITKKKKKLDETPTLGDPYLDLLWEEGKIEMEAISHIRGRSIPDSFLIIDEAQNLSIHELKTIITRAGDNTKIVLTGDVEQIDNPHVNTHTNGLSVAIEKFKKYDIAGHVTLLKGERSPLASLASTVL